MHAAIRTWLPYAALTVVLIAGGLWIWRGAAGVALPAPEGISVICSQAACAHHFTIPRDQSRTYPRGPAGEGFQCAACGRFSAQIALQCETCARWYLPAAGPGRSDTDCPHCHRPEAQPPPQP